MSKEIRPKKQRCHFSGILQSKRSPDENEVLGGTGTIRLLLPQGK